MRDQLAKCQKRLVESAAVFRRGRSFLQMLQESLDLRRNYLIKIRKFIAVRSKVFFQHYMLDRGYEGQLKFIHREQKLVLTVKTSHQERVAAQGGKDVSVRTDTKSLSGGEKCKLRKTLIDS